MHQYNKEDWVNRLGRLGLITKGLVYMALGTLAFLSAFELAGRQEKDASREGVFQWFQNAGGSLLLWVIAFGLLSYCTWRFIEAFRTSGSRVKWIKRVRYFLSGMAYASVAFTAASLALHENNGNNGNQHWVQELLGKPFGVLLVGLAALVFAGVGVYQMYYGYAGKYRKHVEELHIHNKKQELLAKTGKAGYMARGVVWLLLAFMLGKASLNNRASEAGDTSQAFQLVENATLGSWMLGAMGIGLVCYGVFSFLRAGYGRFNH